MGIARNPEPRAATRARDDIALVLRHDELAPVFQPIVDIRTGLVAGYEALARFTRGRSRPTAEWFERAHAGGQGLRLEAHAAAAALAIPRRPYGSFLSINLSASGLASADVADALPERLDGIMVELTGHGPSLSEEALREATQAIRARGARLAVDLASSDYAGLRAIAFVAPDMLKLDRSLVHRIHADRSKAALVESLVRYGRELGIAVCAEGVESLEDLERLAELDVMYAQGYAVGRPTRPWQSIDPAAARVCRNSVAASLTGSAVDDPAALGADGRLQWLSWRLSEATTYAELAGAIDAITAELGADDVQISVIEGDELVVVGAGGPDRLDDRYVIADYPETARLLREQGTSQVLARDPAADAAEVALLGELGFSSVLLLPVCCAGAAIGLLEAYSLRERPWSRFEIGRARIIALQLGAALERIGRR